MGESQYWSQPATPRRDVRQRLDLWLEMGAALVAVVGVWLFFGGAALVYGYLLLRMLTD